MVTLFVYLVLALVVVAALVALAVLVLPGNEELAAAPPDRTPWALPAERAMTGTDVGRLRLPVTLRGYRFAETDAVLDRLGEEIAYRDAVIATLRSELEGRGGLGDPEAEVLGDAPVLVEQTVVVTETVVVDEFADGAADGTGDGSRDGSGDDEPPVELGETPEETEGQVARPGVVALDDELPDDDDLPTRP